MIDIKEKNGRIEITVSTKPGAKKTRVIGEVAGELKIEVTAPPVEGKANKAVIKLVAEWLDIARSRVSIVSGETSRKKRLSIDGVAAETIARRLR